MHSSLIDHYRRSSPMAAALYDAKETLASGAALARKNARLFFSTVNAARQTWDLYDLFTKTSQVASCGFSAAEQFFLGASLAQTIYGIARSAFGIYNSANAFKKGDIAGGIFHGLIYTPGKISGTAASSMRSTQAVLLLKTGQAASIFSTIGTAASLAQSIFLAISGFYQFQNACQFSQGLEKADDKAKYLFEQAFILSPEKLKEIETEQELQDLLKQQKEAFIRRTSAECYNEVVKHFFNQDVKADQVPSINRQTLESQYNDLKILDKDIEAKVIHCNFLTKVIAGIKMLVAFVAGGSCITLFFYTGGLGLIATASIFLILTGLLRGGSNANELHQAIGNSIWSYQQHRILPESLSHKIANENQQKTAEQVKFASLVILGAATLPVWIVPAAIGFQIKGAWERRHPVQIILSEG